MFAENMWILFKKWRLLNGFKKVLDHHPASKEKCCLENDDSVGSSAAMHGQTCCRPDTLLMLRCCPVVYHRSFVNDHKKNRKH